MSKPPATLGIVLTILGVAVSLATPARSESAEEFFKGKQIALIIGYNPGGSYDVYSRLAAQLLPKYIPGNPIIAVKHMPGVGSVKAANFLFAQGSKDGLTIGMVGQQLALTQALRDSAVAYDMRKFGWLGRFLTMDVWCSTALTRQRFGWQPVQPGLIPDIEKGYYFTA